VHEVAFEFKIKSKTWLLIKLMINKMLAYSFEPNALFLD